MRLNSIMAVLVCSNILFTANLSIAAVNSSQSLLKVNNNTADVVNYWTPERLQSAKPMPLPTVNPNITKEINVTTEEVSISKSASPPTIKLTPDQRKLFNDTKDAEKNGPVVPTDAGTAKEQFSSSRLVPLSADLSYPYTAVGRLFFTIPGKGNFVCSASVISPRVLLTAGHCVHSGANGQNGFYTNWLFIPAYRDGAAPLQKWTWSTVDAAPSWKTGNGSVPNAADYAMIELNDNIINGTAQTLGSVTGALGFATQKLIPNHVHMLGYPCNFDSCRKMHQVTSQSANAVAPNNVEYGSDMQGGSSGGPWVQNFGQPAVGQSGGQNPGFNQVVGVTSWGFVDSSIMGMGASNFNTQFTDLFSEICAHKVGNCA